MKIINYFSFLFFCILLSCNSGTPNCDSKCKEAIATFPKTSITKAFRFHLYMHKQYKNIPELTNKLQYYLNNEGQMESLSASFYEKRSHQYSYQIKDYCFSPDNTKILTASNDSTICLWDKSSLQNVLTIPFEEIPEIVVFSPNGKMIAATSDNSDKVTFFDVENGKMLFSLTNKEAKECETINIEFSLDGKYFHYTRRNENTIATEVYDIATQSAIAEFKTLPKKCQGDEKDSYSAHFTLDGKKIVKIEGEYLKIWDIKPQKLAHNIKAHIYCINNIAFSPDSKSIVTSSADGTAKIWDIETGKLLMEIDAEIKDNHYHNTSATFSSDGKQLATAINDIIKIWDISTGKAILNYTLINEPRSKKIQFSPDGKILMANSPQYSNISIWDFSSKGIAHYNKTPKYTNYWNGKILTKSVFSPDSKNVLIGRYYKIDLWYVGLHKFLLEVAHLD
ncbi:MAG: WD40 repeat domain-containing protein, partial [Bacteroidia bacterium]